MSNSINPTNTATDMTTQLNNMAESGQNLATSSMNQVAADIQSGNTTQAASDMNSFAMGQLQQQEASAMEGEIQDTIKAEIQNLSKA